MPRPVIAMLTDFGTKDHYAGTMKGVALGICPDATLVDITHEIPPYDVLEGALQLSASYRYFPPDTVFLVVVDPGVGTVRGALAAECRGYRFVAPDNGVLSLVFRESPPQRVVHLDAGRFASPPVSRTFEGRDRFGPAAALLASGVAVDALGSPRSTWHQLELPRPSTDAGRVTGQVLQVDRFGNLITNLTRQTITGVGAGALTVAVGSEQLRPIVATYGEAPSGAVCALFGSSGYLEVAVNGGSAAERLHVTRGATVTVSPG